MPRQYTAGQIRAVKPLRIIFLRLLAPAGLCNSRRMDRRCVRERCCRIVDIWPFAAPASDWPLCACAAAFLTFCVLELPWQALTKAPSGGNTTAPA